MASVFEDRHRIPLNSSSRTTASFYFLPIRVLKVYFKSFMIYVHCLSISTDSRGG